ncbi:MAG: divalent metal cation transporter [Anaerolineae bacterium]|jgi:Mn2+/Fe2+ NRAMP family transporter|nr:divalent metal cation transporter [Anaerolineae bacterium]
MTPIVQALRHASRRTWLMLAILGPGLITANAGNDAPGIATYSAAGSHYGYGLLWLLLLVAVGLVVIQEIASRMGAVTGKGTADLIRERFGVRVTAFAMACLLLANLGTTIGEFAGIAAGMELLGVTRMIAVPAAALAVGLLVVRGNYAVVEKVLLVLCLAALSYVVAAATIDAPWGTILLETVTPNFSAEPGYVLAVLATIGTTITPWGIIYMQATVVEKGVGMEGYRRTRIDVVTGAAWGSIVSAAVVITTAATLFANGIAVDSAEGAAMALEPLAGPAARYLFAAGLLGASLLAASVLPLSTTYALSEAFGWERGVDRKPKEAPIFYTIYIGMIAIGALVVLIPGIPLFRLMVLSQALNALLLPVLLVLVLKLSGDRRIMGRWTNGRVQNALAWSLTGFITVIGLLLLISPLLPAGMAP